MERLLNRNRIFVDRTKGVGVLSQAEAIQWSTSGPVARASGVTRDLRIDEPYLSYDDFDFQVCCAKAGDCFARYYVRMAEMRESLKIVEQAIENLPSGPVNLGVEDRTTLPPKGKVYQTIEGTITHFELVMANRGFEVPCDESYAAIEAPNGELGFYVVGDGSNVAYRARVVPRRIFISRCFRKLIRGHTLSDVVAVLGSLNIIAAELDRYSAAAYLGRNKLTKINHAKYRKKLNSTPVLNNEMRDEIRKYFAWYPTRQAVTLPALHVVNKYLRHVPLQAVVEIAELLGDEVPLKCRTRFLSLWLFSATNAAR